MELKLLIIDDEKISCRFIADYLEDSGYDIDTAYNVKSAMELIKSRRYDIVITDKNMPGLEKSDHEGGMMIIKKLRDYLPAAEVIMITGYATIETAIEALKLGAFDYITKPFDCEDLLKIIKRIEKYHTFINPENTISIYKNFQNEILNIIEDLKDINDDERHKLLSNINLKIDEFFNVQKNWEKIILTQRDALINITSYAEQLKDSLDKSNSDFELVDKICKESNRRL